MKLVIPDNTDPKLPVAVQRLVGKKSMHHIGEIYGKPTQNKYLGSGRTNIFSDLSRKEMLERVNTFQNLGIKYEYALNDIVPRARIPENRIKITEELEWLEASPIRAMSATNLELVRLAERHCPSVRVVISFFAGVDNLEKLTQFMRFPNVRAINVDRKIFRNLQLLRKLAAEAHKYSIGIRVIANLGCMGECIRDREHAIYESMSSIDKPSLFYAPPTFYCMRFLYENPERFLRLPIIRPEDLDAYAEAGVESVKLADRTNPTSWVERVIGHYLDGFYDGNLLDLTSNFTTVGLKSMSMEEVAAIDIGKMLGSVEAIQKIKEYRKMLPALMDVSIDNKAFKPLGCNNTCGSCSGQCDVSVLKYDEERRTMVLAQLDQIEKEYLFK